jgi:hypothetical protein
MYIINDSLSKEENLKLAREYSEKAKELFDEFQNIIKKANRLVPGRTFRLTKSQLAKHESPNEVFSRLSSATRSLSDAESSYQTRERAEREKAERESQNKILKQREEEKTTLINEAIEYCISNGRIFNKDGFTVDTAISIANDIAFQKEVNRREEEIGDNYIDFSGQNCEDECSGWNPRDRRCECGNRRVDWSDSWSSSFKDMAIYPEAY